MCCYFGFWFGLIPYQSDNWEAMSCSNRRHTFDDLHPVCVDYTKMNKEHTNTTKKKLQLHHCTGLGKKCSLYSIYHTMKWIHTTHISTYGFWMCRLAFSSGTDNNVNDTWLQFIWEFFPFPGFFRLFFCFRLRFISQQDRRSLCLLCIKARFACNI